MYRFLALIAVSIFCCTGWMSVPYWSGAGVAESGGGSCAGLGTNVFWWNGDDSGVASDYACISGGTLQAAVDEGSIVDLSSDPGTDSSDGGNGYKFVTGQEFSFNASGISFDSSEGNISFDVYIPSMTDDIYLFNAKYDNSNWIYAFIDYSSGRTIKFYHVGQATTVSIETSDTVPLTTWTTIELSYSVTDGVTAVKIGAGSWYSSSDYGDPDSVTALASEPTNVSIDAVVADTFYLDSWAIDDAPGYTAP